MFVLFTAMRLLLRVEGIDRVTPIPSASAPGTDVTGGGIMTQPVPPNTNTNAPVSNDADFARMIDDKCGDAVRRMAHRVAECRNTGVSEDRAEDQAYSVGIRTGIWDEDSTHGLAATITSSIYASSASPGLGESDASLAGLCPRED